MEIPFDERAKLGYVWLVWGLMDGRCDLLAIATTKESRDRYMYTGSGMGRYQAVKHERAFVDHLFGGGLLAMVNKAAARRS
jgi:hypothetical protein